MLRTFLLVSLLTACTVEAVPPRAQAQASPRYAIMDDYVRDRLARDWVTAQRTDTVQMERAYCLQWQMDVWAGEPAYRVTQISAAEIVEATPITVQFHCPPGPNTAQLHIHPPHTCMSAAGPCWKGGPYAWQCLASDKDELSLARNGEPFGLVQCDEHAVVAFFPRR